MKKQANSIESELLTGESSIAKKAKKKSNKKKEKREKVEEKIVNVTEEKQPPKQEKKESKKENKKEKKVEKKVDTKKKEVIKPKKAQPADDGWESVVEKPKGTKAKAEAKKQAEIEKVAEQKEARAAAAPQKQKKAKKPKSASNLPPELLAQAAAIEAKFAPTKVTQPTPSTTEEWTEIKDVEIKTTKKIEKPIITEAAEETQDKKPAFVRAPKVYQYEYNQSYWRENQPENVQKLPGKAADLIESW